MNSPQPQALRKAESEWVGEIVVDMAAIQGGVVKGRRLVLVVRCPAALKVGSYL